MDRLRSETDRLYNRLDRIRAEINVLAKSGAGALVPKVPALPDDRRYVAAHARLFRLLKAVSLLREARRGVHRSLAGLKKSWFGYVAQRKADLAAKHDAVVVTEDLDILSVRPSIRPTRAGHSTE